MIVDEFFLVYSEMFNLALFEDRSLSVGLTRRAYYWPGLVSS